jgi:hypothetical protein
MINEGDRDPASPTPHRPALRRPMPRRPDRWRQWWLAIFALVLVVTTGLIAARHLRPPASHPVSQPSSLAVTRAPVPEPTPSATPSPSASATTPDLTRLLQDPGRVPTHGSGTFRYAATTGPVLGTKGPLHRFRVGVENGSGEDVTAFAAVVQATLGDPRSWTGGGTLRLQLVAAGQPYDFTVYLVTRTAAGEMCEEGGTDIVIHGRPYTSCRTIGKAIINLDRWRLSAGPYLAARVPLADYRQYVINHEVGHELGHHHVGCPKAGGPAPVMVQQTLRLRGCVPYAWPRRGNSFLTGPPV